LANIFVVLRNRDYGQIIDMLCFAFDRDAARSCPLTYMVSNLEISKTNLS